MSGFKLKTRKAAAKRFRKATGTGKIVRSKGAHGHFLAKRGQKARNSQGTTMVHESNFEQVNRLVPALGAKRKRSKAIKNAIARASAAKAAAAPQAAQA
jgi:ribosomal protein L35